MPEGVQNTGAEVSELQLMAENQTNVEATTEPTNESPPQTGCNRATAREACMAAVMRNIINLASVLFSAPQLHK